MNATNLDNSTGVELTCFECKTVTHSPNKCDKCGYHELEWKARASNGCDGIFCPSCNRGYTSWNCVKCGKMNAITGWNAHIKREVNQIAKWIAILMGIGMVFLGALAAIKNMSPQ
jgi:hypothetical protein